MLFSAATWGQAAGRAGGHALGLGCAVEPRLCAPFSQQQRNREQSCCVRCRMSGAGVLPGVAWRRCPHLPAGEVDGLQASLGHLDCLQSRVEGREGKGSRCSQLRCRELGRLQAATGVHQRQQLLQFQSSRTSPLAI